MLSWRSISSCASYSGKELENWKQFLHEISTRRCAIMARALRWVGTEVREPPSFYGQNDLEEFFKKFGLEVLESQMLLVLDISLKETPARWWGTHKEKIHD
jgi:hypothetical protein